MKIGQFMKARALVAGALLVPGLLLGSCGNPTDTPVPPTNTAAAAAPTSMPVASDTPAAMAPTAMAPTAMAPTAMATTAMTATAPTAMATTAMSGTAPTAMAPTALPPTPGPTPASSWTPGAHKGTMTAPAHLVNGGTLTFGSDVSYPPQEYADASGNPVGFDIDVASEIASRMGLQLKVVNFKFDDILPALSAGQFDAVISAMTIKPEREKVVDFVSYYSAGQAVLVAKGNPKGIKTLDDLSGKTAVAESGTTEQDTLTALNQKLQAAGKPQVNVLIYPTDTDAVDQLRVGRADATLHDSPVAAYYAKLSPSAFEVAIPNFDAAPEGIATAKTNADMHTAIQKALDAMKADGTLNAIMAKWGLK
ncbi:MAG: ABC transporter substrate-binding protein [Chloroflexia bacterium]